MFEDWTRSLATIRTTTATEAELRCLLRDAAGLRAATDALIARAAAALGSASSVRGATRCTQREADRAVSRGTLIHAVPAIGEALATGDISSAHVDTLARAAERTSAPAVARSGLLALARSQPADAMHRHVDSFVRRTADDRDLARRLARQHRERRAVLTHDHMGVLHAEFDDSTFHRIRAAVDAEMDRTYRAAGGRDRDADAPTPQQRRADAIASLLLREAGATDTRPGPRTTPSPRPAGPPALRNQAILIAHSDGTGHIPGVGPLPTAEVQRLLCTSDLHGIVFSADGRPLWLGERVRLATDDQWLALIARDDGCIGCSAHPARCEAHHIRWVRHGGTTDIDNLVLVCSHCHHLIHDKGWRVINAPHGNWALAPP